MNSFSIFYLLPLFCVSFAPAQANREKVCKLASASVMVVDSNNQTHTQKFDGRGILKSIHLYKSYNKIAGKTYFQVEDSSGLKSDEFQMNLRHSVFVGKEITGRSDNINARLTLKGDTSAFYRNVFAPDVFSEIFKVDKFILEGKTLDVTAIRMKTDEDMCIFMAVSGKTPRLVFPSSKVKSLSHKSVHEEMNFNIEADEKYAVFVEFDRLADANMFHECIEEILS